MFIFVVVNLFAVNFQFIFEILKIGDFSGSRNRSWLRVFRMKRSHIRNWSSCVPVLSCKHSECIYRINALAFTMKCVITNQFLPFQRLDWQNWHFYNIKLRIYMFGLMTRMLLNAIITTSQCSPDVHLSQHFQLPFRRRSYYFFAPIILLNSYQQLQSWI